MLKLRMHYLCIYWYLKNYQKSSKFLFHCLIISCLIGWLLECFYAVYHICIYIMMRKWYERIGSCVSLCLLNINSQRLRFMLVAVWEHCVYCWLHVQMETALGRLLQNFLAKKVINELCVCVALLTEIGFLQWRHWSKVRSLQDVREQMTAHRFFSRKYFRETHSFKVLFLMWKIVLALWLTQWVRTIWSTAENKNSHFCAH